MRFYILLLAMGWASMTLAQRHCKCSSSDAETYNNRANGSGRHNEVLQSELQHPVTTFYRWGDNQWFDPDANQSTNLTSLRAMVKLRWDFEKTLEPRDKSFISLYENIWTSANETLGEYDPAQKGESKNARIAKNAAFVVLCDLDENGNKLSTTNPSLTASLKAKAIEAIQRLEWDSNKYPDDRVFFPSSINYVNNHYWVNKTLVMLLQAYDYLKAVDPTGNDVTTCGYLLQCYTKHIFDASGSSYWGVLGRRENHGLTAAGAVGLASVVLADHSASEMRWNWQPETWASTAHWRILKTLWDTDENRHESERGDVNGFAEGTHYFRHSFENLLPFFLAYKNALPETDLGEDYGPLGAAKMFLTFKADETLNTNYWDDPDIANLIKWWATLTLPNTDPLMLDDSAPEQSFVGILSFREASLFHQYHPDNLRSTSPLNKNRIVDMRADAAAAFAEGALNNFPTRPVSSGTVLASGDIVLRPRIQSSDPGNNLEVFFHLNAEAEGAGTTYLDGALGGDDHEFFDAMSFCIFSNNGYQMLAPGQYKTEAQENDLRYYRSHSTITVKGRGKKNNGPVDGEVTVVSQDFTRPWKEVIIQGHLKKGGNEIPFQRKVKYYNSLHGGVTFRVTDSFLNVSALSNNTYEYRLQGRGLEADDTYSKTDKTFFWSEGCEGGNRATSIVRVEQSGGTVSFDDSENSQHRFNSDNAADVTDHTQLVVSIEEPDALVIRNWIYINSCTYNFDTIIPLKSVEGVKISTGNLYDYNIVNRGNDTITLDSLFSDAINDTLNTDVSDLALGFDFNGGGPCQVSVPFRNIWFQSGHFVKINDKYFVKSKHEVRKVFFNYNSLYNYSGSFKTSHGNDTLEFYLPEVPPASISSMVEESGLNFQYDSLTQTISLLISQAGEYDFKFAPAFPCKSSCFFSDYIVDHTIYTENEPKRLGDSLSILADSGWLEMKDGAKMMICSGAICTNFDSLTLASCLYDDVLNASGYPAEYRTYEDALYRDSYTVGSGASAENISGYRRTMIIVEDQAALVLKKGSKTHIHNGGTILVKPGGTLKIEDSAYVEIGNSDSCYGFGEIIVMDSAFLCIGSKAVIEFGNDGFDTIDRNIFYISNNSGKPALASVNPNGPAEPASYCLPFCEMVDTFPTHGIGNHTYGWLNVGKLRPWLTIDDVVCPGQKVDVNGLYSLNETRYRFEICKYDTTLNACTGTTDTVLINYKDNYFGGRLQGKLSLSDYYSFESGNDYRVKYKVGNDCGQFDELTNIVHLPGSLTARIGGDTVVCGGLGSVSVNSTNSMGNFNSVAWKVWEYVPIADFDSANYIQNADTFIVLTDTILSDSLTIDSIGRDTLWFNKLDSITNDSIRYGGYYKSYWDTLITVPSNDTFEFSNFLFKNGTKYMVTLTLSNPCGKSSDTLIVRTKDGPDVSAGPDKSIPFGSPWVPNPTLEGSIGNATSHSWSPTTALTPSTSLTPKASPSSTTKYVLSGTDADGCTNTDTMRVIVNTIAHAGRDTVLCSTATVQVGTAAVSGYAYRWSPASAVSNNKIAQPTALATASDVTLILKVYQGTTLVGIDDVEIKRDVPALPNFSVNPGGGFYEAAFEITQHTITATDLDWDYDDGTGSHTNKSSYHAHTFPSVPSTVYDVCVSYTNACGLQETCKDCEFDISGNVVPIPIASSVNQPSDANKITLQPNPFKNTTTLTYDLDQNVVSGSVEIFDITGKNIKTYDVSSAKGSIQIDLSEFAEGVYRCNFIVNGVRVDARPLIMVK